MDGRVAWEALQAGRTCFLAPPASDVGVGVGQSRLPRAVRGGRSLRRALGLPWAARGRGDRVGGTGGWRKDPKGNFSPRAGASLPSVGVGPRGRGRAPVSSMGVNS